MDKILLFGAVGDAFTTDTVEQAMKAAKGSVRVVINSEELFTPQSWVAVALGQGLMPERYDPLADLPESKSLTEQLAALRELTHRTAQSLTSHRDFLGRDDSQMPKGRTTIRLI